MLTVQLVNRFKKVDVSAKTCPHCKRIVDPNSEDTEYIRSKVNEQFFHRSCFIKAYKECVKK